MGLAEEEEEEEEEQGEGRFLWELVGLVGLTPRLSSVQPTTLYDFLTTFIPILEESCVIL